MHIVALFANVVGLAIATIWAASARDYEPYLAVVALAGTLPLALRNSVASYVASTFQSMGVPVAISLLGKPASGKTVFLMAQLHALMHTSRTLTFVPRTTETIERLLANFRILSGGNWVHRTSRGAPNEPFSGTLLVRRKFGKRVSCDVSLFDSPGETLNDIRRASFDFYPQTGGVVAGNEKKYWMHQDPHFDNALKCQHLFLFIDPDCDDIYDYVAAILILASSLVRNKEMKVSKTVAIIFSKADLLTSEAKRKEIEERAQPLLAACERVVCAHRTFFVSSTGELINGSPPSPLKPENLLSPIEWCLAQKIQ